MLLSDKGGNMAKCLATLLLFVALVAGQTSTASFAPSNDTLPSNMTNPDIELSLTSGTNALLVRNTYNIAPLTAQAGIGQSETAVNQININGTIIHADASNASNLSIDDIVYMSCDPNESSNIDSTQAIIMAGNAQPKAILLFSIYSQECSVSGDYTYGSLYTMVSASDSMALLVTLDNYTNGSSLVARFVPNESSSDTGSQTSNNGGPPPTTAVAMSILYSITGIITLLFLIIIATGAIRAHRHPERYGPRNAPGRPRQSRAKGLARAMLETLPIVKFGDPEPGKPGSDDIELENGSVHHAPVTSTTDATTSDTSTVPVTAAANSEKGLGAHPESGGNEASTATKEGELLQCSICTEDFATGEDVRVLPCHHKYHPACIDPWLLNVSGTCPLCRHDLRPTATHAQSADDELAPPLDAREGETASQHTAGTSENGETSSRSRVSRLMHLRNAPPEESIATLREYAREQSQQEVAVPNQDGVEEQGRRASLAGRLRTTLRIRTRAQASTEPETTTATTTTTT
ncbi:hypothetical protein BCIN_02g02330 [Botrytis cinerea B05.10]|uniref:RING-type domain-containing protein n=3 Tax=Botryotinia fuckeliana TaxID=40559 RepID=A0A384J867_BOTFB|nr:hypothetical protein BCIN_02g02330 [Botrytis cinerea B05.10]ATZ46888.1 hypothetical protein BCIN_02g02330 [Botrytis cinerea B05.10]EMR85063.1 putative ring-7 protein [Botrytis cinerea BcDW1]CCD48594.1 hypothetical protein BofuT4_P109780.1 [Botrytis cinerea T4]